MQIARCVIFGLVLAAYCPTVAASEIDVLEWTLTTGVQIGVLRDNRVDTTVSNPLQRSYSASLQNSTAFSTINASWDTAGFFEFLLTGEYAGQGSDLGWSRSTVSIFLTPTVDSILTIDAEYNYALGSGDRRTLFGVSAGQVDVGSLYSVTEQALPIGGDPRVGTHIAHQIIPLEAGATYGFGGTLEISSFSGSPTNLSLADGHMRFSIVPVPEPTTALLLTFAAASVAARRRRPHASRSLNHDAPSPPSL